MPQKTISSESENTSHSNILLASLCVPMAIIFMAYPWLTQSVLTCLDIWIFLISGYFLIYQCIFRSNTEMTLVKFYPGAILLLIPCLMIFQSIPLPAPVIKALSPKIFEDTKWISLHAPWVLKNNYAWGYMSFFPEKSIQLAMHGISSVLIFVLLINLIKTRFQLSIVLYTIIASLTSGTLAGCLFFYDWSEKSQFISIDHHIALMINLLIPLCLGLLITFYRQSKKPIFKTFFYSLKITVNNLIQGEHATLMKLAMIFVFIFGFVLITRSLGLKMLSLSISLFVGGLILSGKKKMRSQVIVWGGIGLALGVYSLVSNPVSSPRQIDYLSIQAFNHHPMTGIGLGALPTVTEKYIRTPVSFQDYRFNAWLKVLAEMGLLGCCIIVGIFSVFLFRMNAMWHKRQHPFNVGWGLGIMTSLMSIAFLGLGYGFGNPYLVMPVIASLAACGFLVLHAGHHSSRQAFFYRKIIVQRKSLHVQLSAGLIFLILLFGAFQLILSKQTDQTICNCMDKLSEKERIQKLQGNILQTCLWHQMAQWYRHQNNNIVERLNKQIPRADICYETACYLSPKSHLLLFESGRYWVWRSSILNNSGTNIGNNFIPENQHQGIALFQKKFRALLKEQPDKLIPVVDAIWQWYKDDHIVLDAIPEYPGYLRKKALEYILLQKNE